MVYVNSIDHIIKGHESGVDNCIFLPHPQKACGILMMDKKCGQIFIYSKGKSICHVLSGPTTVPINSQLSISYPLIYK